jgi:hypothetical protein
MTADYFDRFEAELRRAVPRAASQTQVDANRSGPRTGAQRRVGWLSRPILLLNAVVIVAIAVALVVLLGGHGASQSNPKPAVGDRHHRGGSRLAYAEGSVATHTQLVQNFAVVRRAENAGDRGWRRSGEVRLAKTFSGGYRVFLQLGRFRVAQEDLPAGSWVLSEYVVSPNGDTDSVSFLPNTGYTVTPLNAPTGIHSSIVPDGVASVTWQFSCRGGAQRCTGIKPRRFTVPVTNNVAAQRITANTCASPGAAFRNARKHHQSIRNLLTGCLAPSRTIWRNANGRVVAVFPNGYGNLPAPPFVASAPDTRRALPLVLQADGIGDMRTGRPVVRIGEPIQTATRTLTRWLGEAAIRHQAISGAGCAGTFEFVWTSPSVATPLTVYGRDGKFIAYKSGVSVDEIGLQADPGIVLEASRGLTIGATVRSAKHLYGSKFTAGIVANRGTDQAKVIWHAASHGGTLTGALLPNRYPVRQVTADDVIANISAGQAACQKPGS